MNATTIEWLQLILSAAGSAFVAGWTVFQFMYNQKQKREEEAKQRERRREEETKRRAQESRLYVNPFILAANSLQSRLYNILEKGGLSVLKSQDPSGVYAEKTLYLIAEYLGWELILMQQGPYTADEHLRKLTEAIHKVLSTDRYGVQAFCIFRSDQKTLGQVTVRRINDNTQPEYEAIPFYEFNDRIKSSPLAEIKSLSNILSSLKNAHGVNDLQGSERLAILQCKLVELLEYLERNEGYKVYAGNRAKARVIDRPA